MEAIFSTKERIKILRTILFTIEAVSVNTIARKLHLSKGLVSKYFEILQKAGILRRICRKNVVSDTSLVKGIKILLNIRDINTNWFKKYPFITAAGLYGSCAKGENTEESDVDLWIRVEKANEEKMAALTSDLNKKIQQVKLLFLTGERLDRLKKEDELFYHSLAFGSIVVYGNNDAI